MSINAFEILGYLASVLVLLSMLMSSILKLRIVNMIGAAIFSVYGFLIHAMPVGFLNMFIVFANIYYLLKINNKNDSFSSLEVKSNNLYLLKFLEFFKADILKYVPDFNYSANKGVYAFFILRNMAVAGVFLAERLNNNTLFINLDYVIPEYRDLKPGGFLYKEKQEQFKRDGYQVLATQPKTKEHSKYLNKMGFVKGRINHEDFYLYKMKE